MDDAKKRVQEELLELGEKASKLVKFMSTEKYFNLSKDMRYLMYDQLRTMIDYINILHRRLEIWGKTDDELNSTCKIC